MTRLLLHTCCAPCTTYVHRWFKESEFEVEGFFYNPNIQPTEEYQKRRRCMEYYSALSGLIVTYIENDREHEPGNCYLCYENRFRHAAQFAKANRFDLFTTTLLVSPYQKHDLIREIGRKIEREEGIGFLYHDLREGYYKGVELAKRYNLYRQKYCGCLASLPAPTPYGAGPTVEVKK